MFRVPGIEIFYSIIATCILMLPLPHYDCVKPIVHFFHFLIQILLGLSSKWIRIFLLSFQVLPQLLYYFGVKNDVDSLDWATIVAYTCMASCEASVSYKEEFVWVQLSSSSPI